MTPPISRRDLLRAGAVVLGGAAAAHTLGSSGFAFAAAPRALVAPAPTLPWPAANEIVAEASTRIAVKATMRGNRDVSRAATAIRFSAKPSTELSVQGELDHRSG